VAATREVSIVLKAKDEASKVIDNIAKGSIPNLAKVIGGLAATYASLSAAKGFVSDAIAASESAQGATVNLGVAIRNTGQAVEQSFPAYQAAAEHIQVRHLRPSVPTLEDVFAHAVGEA